jgi:hypothetical protein
MADALVFEEDFKAVVEEGDQIFSWRDTIRCGIQ